MREPSKGADSSDSKSARQRQFELEIETLDGKSWVTLRQFATAVGVSYLTALHLKDAGHIDPREIYQVGGRWRITVKELNRFMREGNMRVASP
jgi:hypothetical protein